jgi:L-alanine-DL-glutamate epimerase-like enolase superfamily enzyme
MCQNLANPSQSVKDVLRFLQEVEDRTPHPIDFLEEPFGPMELDSYPLLRTKTDVRVCGGEILTTAAEMCRRVTLGMYDFVQPDATVIGGMGQVREVFLNCKRYDCETVVHCWGGGVGLMANYHIALACGGILAEWPMPDYTLRRELLVEPLRIENGRLLAPSGPGLGVHLTPELERKYPFREDAVYSCLASVSPDVFTEPWE